MFYIKMSKEFELYDNSHTICNICADPLIVMKVD